MNNPRCLTPRALLRNAKGLPFWVNIDPILELQAFVSYTNGLVKSGRVRTEASHKAIFRMWKAFNAPSCQRKLFYLSIYVRGLLITLNLLMNFL